MPETMTLAEEVRALVKAVQEYEAHLDTHGRIGLCTKCSQWRQAVFDALARFKEVADE